VGVMVTAVAVLVMLVEGAEEEASGVVVVMVEVAISLTNTAIDLTECKEEMMFF
jgi:hypothetical protein